MIGFNPGEIFEMAQQIERDGSAFYRKAADNMGDAEASKLLQSLAAMEDDHEKTFAAMAQELTAAERSQSVFDPDQEAQLYLEAIVDGKVFDPRNAPAGKLSGRETLGDILRTAITLEWDSILFYLGIKDAVRGAQRQDRVESIVKEEMSHVSTLRKRLKEAV